MALNINFIQSDIDLYIYYSEGEVQPLLMFVSLNMDDLILVSKNIRLIKIIRK